MQDCTNYLWESWDCDEHWRVYMTCKIRGKMVTLQHSYTQSIHKQTNVCINLLYIIATLLFTFTTFVLRYVTLRCIECRWSWASIACSGLVNSSSSAFFNQLNWRFSASPFPCVIPLWFPLHFHSSNRYNLIIDVPISIRVAKAKISINNQGQVMHHTWLHAL